jgi:hypothetical protein
LSSVCPGLQPLKINYLKTKMHRYYAVPIHAVASRTKLDTRPVANRLNNMLEDGTQIVQNPSVA